MFCSQSWSLSGCPTLTGTPSAVHFHCALCSLTEMKSIPSMFADCSSVKVKFSSDVIPLQAAFIVPDSFSECCTRYGCRSPLKFGRRHHCRCCGLLFCSRCASKEMPLPNYSIKNAHRVCDACHDLFARSPDTHWSSSWIMEKRQEAFRAACDKFTTALDLAEKRPHAELLGLDPQRLWSSDDQDFKQAKLQLNRSHPDAKPGSTSPDASPSLSPTNFNDVKDSCSLLTDWLSSKELYFHQTLVSSGRMALTDESCKMCNRKFVIYPFAEYSKHYCRICGHAICGRPSCLKPNGKNLPASFGFGTGNVSVCNECDQQYPISLHPLVLWQEGYIDYFARIVAAQQEEQKRKPNPQAYLAPLYISRLHVVSTVEAADTQNARVTLLFSSSMTLEQSEVVTQDLGRLKCSVIRPASAFEVLRTCLLNQGYPPQIIPQLGNKTIQGYSAFMNAVLQHRRLRNSSLIPLFCASSDNWEEIQRVLLRVSNGTDSSLPTEIRIKSIPAMLPCAGIQELLNVLGCCGMLSLWGPLIIKFYSLAQFLTEAIDTARRHEERTSSYQARVSRHTERSIHAERMASAFNEKNLALKELLKKSLDRLSRERIRLAAQRSSVHPVLTRRQQDIDERKANWDWYEMSLKQYHEDNKRFEVDAQASSEDIASCEKMTTECVRALETALKVQSSHHDWMFDALSSLKLGHPVPAIIPAIKVLRPSIRFFFFFIGWRLFCVL